MIFLDTETCGLHGPIVLVQYAIDDGEIILYEPWNNPVKDTLKLYETFLEDNICGFNLNFDWFHICQQYTTMLLLNNKDAIPIIPEYASKESEARFGPCLKPMDACCLMLHARKGPYQSTMNRKDIVIKRVPTALAWLLCQELERRVKLKDIYFARKKNKHDSHFKIRDIEDSITGIDTDFKDIVLKFAPSSGLKALAMDAFNIPPDLSLMFTDIEPSTRPEEVGYAPFYPHSNWPTCISQHISHWQINSKAREYARLDVDYTRRLYDYFGRPEPGDVDSNLACMAGAVRWKGFSIDANKMKLLRKDAKIRMAKAPRAPGPARKYLEQVLSEEEKTVLLSTNKQTLEALSKMTEDCPECYGEENEKNCPTCKGARELPHPVASRAKDIEESRGAEKEVQNLNKLISVGRFHASIVIIGAKSGRGSGDSGLNAQGIKRTTSFRECFTFSDDRSVLCGGDFDAFEVSLAEAVYNDPGLRKDLLEGTKIHAVFGSMIYPPNTYEDILATKGKEPDLYNKGKSGLFSQIYMGNAWTLFTKLGVPMEIGEKANENIRLRYPGIAKQNARVTEKFTAMSQISGVGSRITWKEPADYVESFLGFKRYFTLENQIIKTLFNLANNIPENWKRLNFKVKRREERGLQTAFGATQTAIFAAAFGLQAANIRAAGNHEIQSPGASLTKQLQSDLWELQPIGIGPWIVQCLNIHDEVMASVAIESVEQTEPIIKKFINEHKKEVPLIAMNWKTGLANWAGKS